MPKVRVEHLRVSGMPVNLTHKRQMQTTAINDKIATLGPPRVNFFFKNNLERFWK